MARPKQTVPSVHLNLALTAEHAQKLEVLLHSELEGRIPMGAYKAFFAELLDGYFKAQQSPCKHCQGTGAQL